MINIERAGTGQHKRSNEPHREISNEMVCAPSKDSDQPGHPPSLIRVFTVRLKIDRILSYSLSAQWRLWSDWASAHCRLSLRWAHMQIRWFCHDAAQIKAELFLEMTQWKNFMSAFYVCSGTSFRFHKKAWSTVTVKMTENVFFFFFFFVAVFFSFMCHVCVLSLICLFILSGESDALHQLSVKKKRILWKYSIQSWQSLKTADAVLLSLFMRDNGICDISHAA